MKEPGESVVDQPSSAVTTLDQGDDVWRIRRSCCTALLQKQDLVAKVAEASVLIVGRMNRAERYKGHDELLEC